MLDPTNEMDRTLYCDECGEELPEGTPPALVNPRKGRVYHCDECAEEYSDSDLVRKEPWTDKELRELGYKELYPGYFEGDPRYPRHTAEDRYLMDHPGPPKVTSEQPPRRVSPMGTGRKFKWDEEQFAGQDIEYWKPKPTGYYVEGDEGLIKTQTKEIRSGEAEQILSEKYEELEDRKITGLWICKVCRKNFALWPSERAWRKNIYGLRLTLIFRAPIACTNCRIMRQRETQHLGHEDCRLFWKVVIALWEGEQPPTGPTWLGVWVRRRNRLLNRFSRVNFGRGRAP